MLISNWNHKFRILVVVTTCLKGEQIISRPPSHALNSFFILLKKEKEKETIVRNTTLVRKDKYSHPVSIYISELLASTILSTGEGCRSELGQN